MKYLLTATLVFTMILLGHQASASSCGYPNDEDWIPVVQEYIENSEIIFIGEVLKSGDSTNLVKVVDTFKGHLKMDTVSVSDGKYGFFNKLKEGLGIFYVVELDDGSLYLSHIPTFSCGISRNLTLLYSYGSGPISSNMDYEVGMNIEKGMIRIDNVDRDLPSWLQILRVKNWINEYALLTAYRNSHQKIEEPENASKEYLSYIAIGLSALALAVALFKKR